jgi:hypothetical protein
VLALSSGLGARAAANGGPSDGTEVGARGGLTPRQSTTVKLGSEELTITVDPDGKHYDVSAKYLLSNPGPETTVRYGVPLLFADDAPKGPRRAADAVRIKVGDRESRCTLIKETVRLAAESYEHMEAPPIGGWCISRLTIPSGEAIPLLLSYRADLLFTDYEVKSTLVSFGLRALRYLFFPAGYWIGPAERLSVTVDLGRFAGLEQVMAPPGVAKQDGKLVWTFTNIDLKKLPDLELTLDVGPIAHVAALASYRKVTKLRLAAKAAKATKTAGDVAAAARAVDGDPGTSWCVDKPGPDSWIEVTLRKIDAEYAGCNWEGMSLSSATSEKTARIRKVRLEGCHDRARDGPAAAVDMPVRRVDAAGPWGLTLSSELYSELPKGEQEAFVAAFRAVEADFNKRGCVRVSILEVEGNGPACIGELAPLRDCD